MKSGVEMTLRPKHIIMATGIASEPRIPDFKGMEGFKGDVVHTKYYKNSRKWEGKKVVVVGAVSFTHQEFSSNVLKMIREYLHLMQP